MVNINKNLDAIERTMELDESRAQYVCLDRNERASEFSDEILAGIKKVITSRSLSSYPDPGPFSRKLAAYIDVPIDHLIVTPGADGAIRRAFISFLSPGGVVSLCEPSYAMYALYTKMFGGEVAVLDYGEDLTLDLAAFTDAIGDTTQIVILANPNQPTGSVVPLGDLREIAAKAQDVGALFLIDETYHDYNDETALELVREFDNVLLARSFSKAPGLAGLRLGYAVGQPHLISALNKVRGASEVTGVSLAIGEYVLENQHLVHDYLDAVEQGRVILIEALKALGFGYPPCKGNFQLVQLPSDIAPAPLLSGLRAKGFLIKGGFEEAAIRRHVRVSLDGPEVMEPFVRVLREVVAEMRGA